MKEISNWFDRFPKRVLASVPWILFFCKNPYLDFGRWYRRNDVYKFKSPQKIIFRIRTAELRRKYGIAPEGVVSKHLRDGSYEVNMRMYEIPYSGGRILPKADKWVETGSIPDSAKRITQTMICDKWEIEYYFKALV